METAGEGVELVLVTIKKPFEFELMLVEPMLVELLLFECEEVEPVLVKLLRSRSWTATRTRTSTLVVPTASSTTTIGGEAK
jgi:hypothetical protein